MPLDVKEFLYATAYSQADMDKFMDPKNPTFLKFDPELGHLFDDFVMPDGVDESLATYTFEPAGHRKMINYADRPCRINTYGDSFTQCQQVSDGETWQEVLAAHIREPIRNFGIGGYGVYHACLRALRAEATDVAAEYVILNIWDDDHIRSLDAARWIITGWAQRGNPWAGGDAAWPICGFPWAHLRWDLDKGRFVELPGLCKTHDDLRKLADADYYYETFKDDSIVHLYTLRYGGEAPIEELEALAEALGVRVDLADPRKRSRDAARLHRKYGLRSTIYLIDKMSRWARRQGKKLMILLTYGPGAFTGFVENGRRFDSELIEHLDGSRLPYVDGLTRAAEDYKAYGLSCDDYLWRFYVPAPGGGGFGHFGPYGNHWYAFSIKDEVVNFLDPKPPAYRQE